MMYRAGKEPFFPRPVKEMKKSMKKLQQLLSKINEEYIINTAQQLVQIPSENPPGNEAEIADYIVRNIKAMKNYQVITVETAQNRVNVIALMEGKKSHSRTLLFNGHTDVVPAGVGWTYPPFGGLIKNGRLWGRGACDMKGGLAALLGVMKALYDALWEPDSNLLFAFVADEECGGKYGMRELLLRNALQADLAIVAEPSDFRLSVGENGVIWIKIVLKGISAHTIHHFSALNPIDKAVQLCSQLHALANELQQNYQHPLYGAPILSINVIRSGFKVNIIPDECFLEIDIRLPPELPITIDEIRTRLYEITTELHKRDERLKIEIDINVVSEPFSQSCEILPVKLVSTAMELVTGKKPSWWKRAYENVPIEDSDMYHLVKAGIPTVYFGPGEVRLAHAIDENIKLNDILLAAQIFTAVVYLESML